MTLSLQALTVQALLNNMKNTIINLLAFVFCFSLIICLIGCRKSPQNDNSSLNNSTQSKTVSTVSAESSTAQQEITSSEKTVSYESKITSASSSKASKPQQVITSGESSINSSSALESSIINSTATSSVKNSTSTDLYYDELRPWYNIGYNKQLRGTPIIYAIFMDDDESSWDTASIESFLSNEIDPAVAFLEDEAKKWGVSLDLSVRSFATTLNQGYTFKYEGIVNRNLRENPSTKDVLIKAAADFGYSSEEALQEAVSASHGGKEIIFLCLFNKDGTCYTRNQITNGSTTLVEEVVFFRFPLNTPEWIVKKGQRASVVAHEILHAFGAEDFYITTSRENLAEQYYPNDIMLWQYTDISQNKLGDCVAYSVGWTNTVPEVCRNDEWWK